VTYTLLGGDGRPYESDKKGQWGGHRGTIEATLAELRGRGAEIAREPSDQGWGLLAAIRLPDGGELPIYEPRHLSPHPA
jgi:hypothetical protein